ncbi:hypothetical protein CK203_000123 [Vitis vinifera]|uniref:Uncharacterized protein n=1 Tax=Vitis vinifera TaxID=29760 RepID=A0A438KPM6_VITVI|nr:hypothetical protein CK203_000123 [Vitis vinifera]
MTRFFYIQLAYYKPSLELLFLKSTLSLDLGDAASSEEIARYLDLKKLDERVYMVEAVSAYDGYRKKIFEIEVFLKPKWNKCFESNMRIVLDCRMGIKESVDWLVEVMERSKRTEMLRVRAAVTSPATA